MVEGLQQTQRDYQHVEDEISRLFPGSRTGAGTSEAPAANPDSPISTALDGGGS